MSGRNPGLIGPLWGPKGSPAKEDLWIPQLVYSKLRAWSHFRASSLERSGGGLTELKEVRLERLSG